MEMYCDSCQESFIYSYKDIYLLPDGTYEVVCPICGTDIELPEAEEDLTPEELDHIKEASGYQDEPLEDDYSDHEEEE